MQRKYKSSIQECHASPSICISMITETQA